jgi:5-methylcytosine-specific restriction protein A
MPYKPAKPCRHIGCPNLTHNRYCDDHSTKQIDERASSTQRGYNGKWRKLRKLYLSKHPLCVKCEQAGRLTPATVVDHITPHRGNQALMWDENNWQALCKHCHDTKTGSEDTRSVKYTYKFKSISDIEL